MPPFLVAPPENNCWAEIDRAALTANFAALRALDPDADVMAVVKADAYGHGLAVVAPTLAAAGARRFGVATATEGERVRQLLRAWPDAEIFVLTAFAPHDAPRLVVAGLTPFVSTREQTLALREAAEGLGRVARAHLQVDTGIGRDGFAPGELAAALRWADEWPAVRVTGVCTHFTWGENLGDARRQHALFEAVLRDAVPPERRPELLIHAANSPAALAVAGARYGMIRPGLLLYGIAPSPGQAPQAAGTPLTPVLSLRARVLLARDMAAGSDLSYGRTYTLPRAARIATVGIGYGDGYSRRFSSVGRALLAGGELAPVRGRVCMDQICVELPDTPAGRSVNAGDVVTLVGASPGGAALRAADLAGLIDATPHEITTCLTARVPRVATG